jgi:hypothetical protein
VLVRLRVGERWQQPHVELLADPLHGCGGDAVGDQQVRAQWQVRAVLLDRTQWLDEDAALGQALGDLGRPQVGEMSSRGHARTLPAA